MVDQVTRIALIAATVRARCLCPVSAAKYRLSSGCVLHSGLRLAVTPGDIHYILGLYRTYSRSESRLDRIVSTP